MTRIWRVGLAGVLILAGSPIRVPAQDHDLATAVQAVRIGQQVRLDMAQIGRIEGRFLNADLRTFTLDRDGAPAQFQLGDIERLWERGRSTRKGAWIGAAVGVVVGFTLGLDVANNVCEANCPPLGLGALGGLLLGAGGAVGGAGIGFAIPTWRLRFP